MSRKNLISLVLNNRNLSMKWFIVKTEITKTILMQTIYQTCIVAQLPNLTIPKETRMEHFSN